VLNSIGWADFRYNNGTAASPHITAWTESPGTLVMQDFHSGGTVCSPTRATVLTGRNHFRDCVNYVYGCSDMTECVPDFEFAPQTFTVPMAVRAANKGYTSWFGGKWHLGSFYNDSESLGGRLSSPISHGFDFMNATVEVAPTATTNCECKEEWYDQCDFGHDGGPTHCGGKGNPGGGPPLKPGCCFNYWWNDETATHGVTNLTKPSPDNDANDYLARALVDWIESRDSAPFMAQISIHNCHVPYIGTPTEREKCNSTETCLGPSGADVVTGRAGGAYTSAELDFYACLNEFDEAVGTIITALKRLNYYDNTMVWFTTDNGPEVNCAPEGRCGSGTTGQIPPGTLHRPDSRGPGSAGPLRGRKRDVWEGGHRVPGIISWPAVAKGPAREVWHPVVTMDFMATVLEVLDISRPPTQQDWNFDGVSILPILRGEDPQPRGIGWMYSEPIKSEKTGYAFRYGKWKYVAGGISCTNMSTFNCSKEQLYDMTTDYVENHDLADQFPEVLAAISANFTTWYHSVWDSRVNESKCQTGPVSPFGPSTPAQVPFPKSPRASSACTFVPGKLLAGPHLAHGVVSTQEECCGACKLVKGCVASGFNPASAMRPSWDGSINGGECFLSNMDNARPHSSQTICKPY
jgi:arylsulfatase A-like enzyme